FLGLVVGVDFEIHRRQVVVGRIFAVVHLQNRLKRSDGPLVVARLDLPEIDLADVFLRFFVGGDVGTRHAAVQIDGLLQRAARPGLVAKLHRREFTHRPQAYHQPVAVARKQVERAGRDRRNVRVGAGKLPGVVTRTQVYLAGRLHALRLARVVGVD